MGGVLQCLVSFSRLLKTKYAKKRTPPGGWVSYVSLWWWDMWPYSYVTSFMCDLIHAWSHSYVSLWLRSHVTVFVWMCNSYLRSHVTVFVWMCNSSKRHIWMRSRMNEVTHEWSHVWIRSHINKVTSYDMCMSHEWVTHSHTHDSYDMCMSHEWVYHIWIRSYVRSRVAVGVTHSYEYSHMWP